MNQAILAFVHQHQSAGHTLSQAASAAAVKFSLSTTLIYLSMVQAQCQQSGIPLAGM
ncbi:MULTISPECIES: hypothetical protein [Deefgea]|uniref:Uncharacterized protein n=1 Tax=Deefgea chitinilytica TaxID=570276 RepID=A0ABS2CC77_9NEIS|nr:MULTISPECIES: hypothetical protein [Deefgea]MBM5571677.1 hypothetical protein [Deefgea chitinilytica]MBM9888912.1 hypothetical protein [Deefgea sp. CFH1-16]